MSRQVHSVSVLPVADLDRSIAYYHDALGFEVRRTWGEPPAMAVVGRGAATVFLDLAASGASAALDPHAAGIVHVADVATLCTELKQRGANVIRGPITVPDGRCEIDVADPDGHVVVFAQDFDQDGVTDA